MKNRKRCPHCDGKSEQLGPTFLGVRRMRCTACTRHFTCYPEKNPAALATVKENPSVS